MLSDLDILPGESGSLPEPPELGLRFGAQRSEGGKARLGHAPRLPTRVSTPPRLLKQTVGIGGCPVHTRGPRPALIPTPGSQTPLSGKDLMAPKLFLLQW